MESGKKRLLLKIRLIAWQQVVIGGSGEWQEQYMESLVKFQQKMVEILVSPVFNVPMANVSVLISKADFYFIKVYAQNIKLILAVTEVYTLVFLLKLCVQIKYRPLEFLGQTEQTFLFKPCSHLTGGNAF